MLNLLPTMLAALNPNNFEWLIPVVAVVIALLRIMGAAMGGKNNPKQAGPRPPGAGPRPVAGGEPDPIKGEIEEFLRRVSNRREGQKPREGQGKPQPARRPPGPTSPGDRRKRPAPVIVARTTPPAVSTDPPPQQSVADHVKKFLSTTEFNERTAQRDTIAASESRFEQQVQQTFAHQVGHLKPPAADIAYNPINTTGEVRSPVGATVIPLFSKLSIRDAIVMMEVMQRPEHRW